MGKSIGKAMRAYLLADSTVSSLVGAARISPNHEAQKPLVYPYVVYQRISEVDWKTFAGSTKQTQTRMQIDCYGASYEQATTLAEAIIDRMNGKKGLWGEVGSPDSVCVTSSKRDDLQDDYEEPIHGDEIGEHVVRLDFIIVWKRG